MDGWRTLERTDALGRAHGEQDPGDARAPEVDDGHVLAQPLDDHLIEVITLGGARGARNPGAEDRPAPPPGRNR
jgi:hypothetical protein